MPEFVLEGRDHAARAESAFVLGFIEAMFFTNVEPSYSSDVWDTLEVQHDRHEGLISELPGDVGYTDLHPDTLAAIRGYCTDWQAKAEHLLAQTPDGYTEVQAGCDLWFTMNGHGVGFWDRGLGDVGDKLSDLARYNEVTPYFEAPFVHLEI